MSFPTTDELIRDISLKIADFRKNPPKSLEGASRSCVQSFGALSRSKRPSIHPNNLAWDRSYSLWSECGKTKDFGYFICFALAIRNKTRLRRMKEVNVMDKVIQHYRDHGKAIKIGEQILELLTLELEEPPKKRKVRLPRDQLVASEQASLLTEREKQLFSVTKDAIWIWILVRRIAQDPKLSVVQHTSKPDFEKIGNNQGRITISSKSLAELAHHFGGPDTDILYFIQPTAFGELCNYMERNACITNGKFTFYFKYGWAMIPTARFNIKLLAPDTYTEIILELSQYLVFPQGS